MAISRTLVNTLGIFLLSNLSPLIQQAAQDERILEAGQVIKRDLTAGQAHAYRIKLSADQFLKVIVEQQGIDVVVQVTGPDGKELPEFNSESTLQAQEPVTVVAEATGDYRLIVQPTQKRAPAGSYEIRIEEQRAATDDDRALQKAYLDYREACSQRDSGKYDAALPLFERAIETRRRILGPDNPDLAAVIFDLAVFYYYRGDYPSAESTASQARAIQERTLGMNHPQTAGTLNLLALLYLNKGDYAKAEPLSKRAVAIKEKALGSYHSSLAFYLANLARIYERRGEYEKAEPLYLRGLAIRENTLGPEHRSVAQSLKDLAILYYNRGAYAKAESLLQRALAIQEKLLGKEHPDVAESLANLANIYRERKDYARAEPLYLRALAIQEKALGPLRPHLARTLNDLAVFYFVKGDSARALAFQSRANTITEYNLSLNLATGSERQKLAFLARVSQQTNFTLLLHSQAAPADPQALDLALTTLLRRKARALDAMTDTIATFRRHATPEDQELFNQLTEARTRLAKLALSEPGESPRLRSIKEDEEKVEKLETDLSRRSARFRAQAQPVTIDAVRAALPADTILVEFAVYTPWNPRTEESGAPHYLAYLLAAQERPKWVDLGETAPIDRAAGAWRSALRDPRRLDTRQLGRIVDEKVMRPVRKLLGDNLGGTRRILIAPEGLLNLIPFAALVDEQKHYLVERFAISYLSSGRDLLRLQASEKSESAPLVMANPAFGRVSALAANRAGARGAAPRVYFSPLPYTEYEALAIKTVLPEASLLLREEATEAALKQVRAPSILHIATHGFFLPHQDSAAAKTTQGPVNWQRAVDLLFSARGAENPLLRSGLVLAGANQGKSGDDDGVLTALEATGLDLWGTKLVVLSACDTGVGEIKNGEGVQGLRRALVLAGSESQVMSLWPISDKGAKEFMTDYYAELTRGNGRSDGLRQVQLRMLQQHPSYWAAFIQSGEWANLEGKR